MYLLSLVSFWYFKLDEFKSDAFEMLGVLHAVDEVPTDQFGHIREWVIGTEHEPTGFPFTQNLLITLGTADMFTVVLAYKICN